MAVTYITQEEIDSMLDAITVAVSATRFELTVPAAFAALMPGNIGVRYFMADKGPAFNVQVDPESSIGWGRKVYPGDRIRLTANLEHVPTAWGTEALTKPVHVHANYDRRARNLKISYDTARPAPPLNQNTRPVGVHEIRVIQSLDQLLADA